MKFVEYYHHYFGAVVCKQAVAKEGPKVKGPKVKGPKVKGPKVKGPKVKGPKVEGPKSRKSTTQHGQKTVIFIYLLYVFVFFN